MSDIVGLVYIKDVYIFLTDTFTDRSEGPKSITLWSPLDQVISVGLNLVRGFLVDPTRLFISRIKGIEDIYRVFTVSA